MQFYFYVSNLLKALFDLQDEASFCSLAHQVLPNLFSLFHLFACSVCSRIPTFLQFPNTPVCLMFHVFPCAVSLPCKCIYLSGFGKFLWIFKFHSKHRCLLEAPDHVCPCLFWRNMHCPELKLLVPLSGLKLLRARLGLTHAAFPKPNTVLGSDEHLGNVSVG